ncbi:MAG: hypothetical protein U0457_14285 [Candidatus Sericytochromatia bacterium]
MNIIGVFIFAIVIGFIALSFYLLIKRFKQHKSSLENINKIESFTLKEELEQQLKQKKEDELKKLETGNIDVIKEVIDRIFKSSKLAGFIKEQSYILYDKSKISVNINLTDKEDIVDSKKQITLKNGELYTQNKHYLSINKEYSEKAFICAYKVLEELFTNIPTIFKVYLNIKITNQEDNQDITVVSLEGTLDDYKSIKNKNLDFLHKLDAFKAKYNYDQKLYQLFEIEPLESSFAKINVVNINNNTTELLATSSNINDIKISDIKNASIMLTHSNLEELNKNVSVDKIDLFLDKLGLNVIHKTILENNLLEIKAIDKTNNEILINYSKEQNIIKEDSLKELFFKAIKSNITKYMFLSEGSFSLDAVNYSNVNNIEIYDSEKIAKILA